MMNPTRSIRNHRHVLAIVALALACIVAFVAGPQATTAAPPTGVTPPTNTSPTTTTPAVPTLAPSSAPAPALTARVDTARGTFRITLRVAEAPISCANFVNLVQRGAYDRSAFHDWTRVLRQSGGPSQSFDPGYTIRREFSAKLMFDGPGMVAMQKSPDGQRAHGTQFFVTVKEQSRWNLDIPIFGTVASGQAVVDALEKGDGITQIVIEGDPAPLLQRFASELAEWNTALDAATSGAHLPALRTVSNAPAAGGTPAAPIAPSAPLVPSAPVAPSAPVVPSAPSPPSAPAGSPRP
jgi:peptidyl-prolyl cis-trans isomerase B (cyclophilin B)